MAGLDKKIKIKEKQYLIQLDVARRILGTSESSFEKELPGKYRKKKLFWGSPEGEKN